MRNALFIAFLLILSAAGQAAVFTWDNEMGDNEWTNPLNWSNNSGLPVQGDTVMFQDSGAMLCRIQTNAHVSTVVVTNQSGSLELVIPSGYALIASYQQNNNTRATNQVLVHGGGEFGPTGNVLVSYAGSSGGYNYSELTVSNLVFETRNLGTVYIGANDDNSGAVSGRLDLAGADVRWDGNPDMLSANEVYLGMEQGRGTWILPRTLTNLTIRGNMASLGGSHLLGPSTIHLGDTPLLQSVVAAGSLRVNNAFFEYIQDGNVVTGLPPQAELVIGTPEKPGAFYYGYTYNSPTDMKLSGFQSLRAWLSTLYVGKCDNSQTIVAELDLSETSVSNLEGSITASSVNIPVILIGGTRGDATGILKLPSTVTNIMCNTLELGSITALSDPPMSVIHLGSNTQPVALTISNNFAIGMGQFLTVGPDGVTNNAFPAGSRLRVGSAQTKGVVTLGAKTHTGTYGLFGKGLAEVTVVASNVYVGRGGWSTHSHFFTNDFREAADFTWEVENDFRIGAGQGDCMYVWFPANARASCSNLVVGTTDYASRDFRGFFNLSNTVLAVQEAVTVQETGIISNWVDGLPSGLDIGSTALDLQDPNISSSNGFRDYGRLSIQFVSDPANAFTPYWGLRLKGDARSVISNLAATNAVYVYPRLTWSTNGLSADAQSRFGVHYDATRDVTYVGVSPLVSGSLILVR